MDFIEDSSRRNLKRITQGDLKMSRKRRDRLYIIAQILDIANKEPELVTHIMYRANLSMAQTYEYLSFLLRIGLLEKVGESYKTTKKGIKYLEVYGKLFPLLQEDTGDEVEPETFLKGTG